MAATWDKVVEMIRAERVASVTSSYKYGAMVKKLEMENASLIGEVEDLNRQGAKLKSDLGEARLDEMAESLTNSLTKSDIERWIEIYSDQC